MRIPRSSCRRSSLALALVLVGAGACDREARPSKTEAPAEIEASALGVVVEAPGSTPVCRARSSDGLPLIPDGVDFIATIDSATILQSQLWSMIGPKVEQGADWVEVVSVFEGCGIPFTSIERLVVGADTDEEFVAVLRAPGIGVDEIAPCVIMKIQEMGGEEPAADIVPAPEDPELSIIQFTDGRAYLLADNLLALTTTAYEGDVARLSRCEGTPALTGSYAALFQSVDASAPLWFLARGTESLSSTLTDILSTPDATFHELALSLRLDAGASMELYVLTDGPATAERVASIMAGLVAVASPNASPELREALARIAIEARGPEIFSSGSLTVGELSAVEALLEQQP